MSTQVSVLVGSDGRAVVVKQGPAGAAARLRAEGERLRQANHPGVVELLRSAPTSGGWELRMVHGGRPVEAVGELTVNQAAALVAGLAATVADLHDVGIVHGRIDATHVLVGEHGRATLCGFGDGSPARTPEDDVADLGALLAALVGAETDGEPIPDRRWRRRRPWTGWDRRGLLLLADQACADPATRRPSARRLAAAVADAVPSATDPLLAGAAPHRPAPDSGGASRPAAVDPVASLRASALIGPAEHTSRWPVRGLAIAGGCLVVAGLVRVRAPEPEVDARRPVPRAGASTEQLAAPLPGGEIEVEGVRYRVGQPGDEVIVDDWDCDGTATPALLRPDTGEIFVFRSWIADGEQRVGPVATVAGARELLASGPDGGCPTLVARTRGGDRVPVLEARS